MRGSFCDSETMLTAQLRLNSNVRCFIVIKGNHKAIDDFQMTLELVFRPLFLWKIKYEDDTCCIGEDTFLIQNKFDNRTASRAIPPAMSFVSKTATTDHASELLSRLWREKENQGNSGVCSKKCLWLNKIYSANTVQSFKRTIPAEWYKMLVI